MDAAHHLEAAFHYVERPACKPGYFLSERGRQRRPERSPAGETHTMAVADARAAVDTLSLDREGEIDSLLYNPDHRWFYVPEMRADEAMLLKCYDSMRDGRARFTAHSAFNDPTSPADAPERESIEVRTLAFFET